jgi:hypothetical protein
MSMTEVLREQEPVPILGRIILTLFALLGFSFIAIGVLGVFHILGEASGGIIAIAMGSGLVALPALVLFERARERRRADECDNRVNDSLSTTEPSYKAEDKSLKALCAEKPSPVNLDSTDKQKGFVARNFSDNQIVFIVVVLVGLVLFVSVTIMKRRDQRTTIAAINSMIETSSTTQPDRYFAHIPEEFAQLEYVLAANGAAKIGVLNVQKTWSGRFLLSVQNAGFGDAEHPAWSDGSDLGIAGRDSSIDTISRIVWMCGSQIENVEEIDVDLETADEHYSATYKVKMSPDASFERKWKGFSDPGLVSLVTTDMVVVADTASGKHWFRTTKN